MHKISCVINFCTIDAIFLKENIRQIEKFSSDIIVVVSDHLFCGKKENMKLLQEIYNHFPQVRFIEFSFDFNQLYTPFSNLKPLDDTWKNLWHSTNRYLGFKAANPETSHVLFLDADEIVDGSKMRNFLNASPLEQNAYWFAAYCYGFSASHLTETIQATALLINKTSIHPSMIFNSQERFGLYSQIEEPKSLNIVSQENQPMIHHYSWVRSQESLLQKTKSWGKSHLENWEEWIKEKRETLHYIEVQPFFDPLNENPNFPHEKNQQPIKLSRNEVLRQQIYELL